MVLPNDEAFGRKRIPWVRQMSSNIHLPLLSACQSSASVSSPHSCHLWCSDAIQGSLRSLSVPCRDCADRCLGNVRNVGWQAWCLVSSLHSLSPSSCCIAAASRHGNSLLQTGGFRNRGQSVILSVDSCLGDCHNGWWAISVPRANVGSLRCHFEDSYQTATSVSEHQTTHSRPMWGRWWWWPCRRLEAVHFPSVEYKGYFHSSSKCQMSICDWTAFLLRCRADGQLLLSRAHEYARADLCWSADAWFLRLRSLRLSVWLLYRVLPPCFAWKPDSICWKAISSGW